MEPNSIFMSLLGLLLLVLPDAKVLLGVASSPPPPSSRVIPDDPPNAEEVAMMGNGLDPLSTTTSGSIWGGSEPWAEVGVDGAEEEVVKEVVGNEGTSRKKNKMPQQ